MTDGQTATANGSLGADAQIKGKLTDAGSGANLQNINVQAVDTNGNVASSGCSDASGNYTVDGLGEIGYVARFVAGGCGAVAAYPTRFYKSGAPHGVLINSAEFLQTITGSALPLGNVALSSTSHVVTVSIAGAGGVASSSGGIGCPGLCTGIYEAGTVVTLTATPGAGQKFTGWTGACSGAAACTFTVSGDTSVSATFAVSDAPAPTTPDPTTPAPTTPGPTTPTPTTPAPMTPTTTGGSGGTPPASTPVPAASTPVPAPGGTAPKTKCSIGTASKVKSGRFTVQVTCDQPAKLSLGGTLGFKSKVKGKTKSVTVKLPPSKVTTATSTTVTFRLPKSALAAFKAKIKVTGKLKLTVTDALGAGTLSSTVKRLR